MAENWICHASRDLPLDTDTSWDGAAAAKAMLDAANIGGDSPDFAKARRGFLLVDDSAKENRTAYSLPFAAVKSGTLTALISGCRAAASRLPQKEGASDGERSKARAVLDAYFAKANKAEKATESAEPGCFGFPARLMNAGERKQAASGDDELLALAKQRAHDAAIFDEYPPLFFSAAISTNQLDAYYTRMHKSSLENFAADLNDGVSLQNSHNTHVLGLGYSLRGRYVGPGGDGLQRAVGDFFTMPASADTQDFVNKLKAGMVRDVSVGFYLGPDGRYVCDLCGNDMMSRSCSHYPGMLYPESENEGASLVRATATIHDARLAEVSAVYDGATPGAGILKAQRMAEAGLLVPDVARALESCYRIRLPGAGHTWPGADLPTDEERNMPNEPNPSGTLPPESVPTTAVRSLLTEAALPLTADPIADLKALVAEVRELRPLKAENERLAPLADLGRQYHADLLQSTLDEGVRAMGNRFPLETQKALLKDASVEQLKTLRASYTEQAAAVLPGGRVTEEKGEPDPNASRSFTTPAANPAHFRA